jgi:hypothetical protein
MQTVVNLDLDVEELLRREVRNRNVEFDRVLNDAVRAGLASNAADKDKGRRFVQKTYPMGSDHLDLTHGLALADELEDEETIRKMRLAEGPPSRPT